jgi:hypothetical protein
MRRQRAPEVRLPAASTQIPSVRVPIVDVTTGLCSREWYRFFANLSDLLAAYPPSPPRNDNEE